MRKQLPITGQRDAGLQEIPLDKIVGSVGRYRDFDRAFLPIQRVTSDRWINISKLRYEDAPLPSIEVYQIGDVYFVRDGNHRVSVARERGQKFIDAYVTSIDVPIQLTPEMALEDVVSQADYVQFMERSQLARLKPEADLRVTNAEGYGRLLEHIKTHAYYLGLEREQSVSYEDAALSWYDTVYTPLVAVMGRVVPHWSTSRAVGATAVTAASCAKNSRLNKTIVVRSGWSRRNWPTASQRSLST